MTFLLNRNTPVVVQDFDGCRSRWNGSGQSSLPRFCGDAVHMLRSSEDSTCLKKCGGTLDWTFLEPNHDQIDEARRTEWRSVFNTLIHVYH